MNMKDTMWNKRLPSFIGVLILVFAIGTITWLSRNAILFGTKAANDNTPKNVQISNITDTSFTVSYVTDGKTTGTISYKSVGQTDQIVFDVRDQTGTAAQYAVHYITVKNLTPATPYSFSITSGERNFTDVSYQTTTAPKNTETNAQELLATGKVTLDNGSPPTEGIASIATDTSQTYSALVDSTGVYKIPLVSLRSKDLSSPITLNEKSTFRLQIINEAHQSNASLLLDQIDNIPLIVLSKNYDFTLGTTPLSPSPVASSSAEQPDETSFPTVDDSVSTEPEILTPQDDQNLKDQQPLFKGTAVPNATVEITINSTQEINTSVTADANGKWQYRPDEKLEPGNHTITIKTIDASGIIKTITQSFVVHAEGSQFTAPSVSPSAPTRTPTPQPTTKPTAKPTNKPTAAPTQKPTNTPTKAAATSTPTKAATPTQTVTTTSTISATLAPLPPTGSTALVISVLGAMVAVGIGALLFFLAAV
jgi:hypothetical protein